MNPKNYVAGIFGRSPVAPLQTHMASVCACAEALLPFFEAVLAEDWAEAEKRRDEIARLEDEADTHKKDIRLNLPKSLFMPVSRGDLLNLLQVQDHLANGAKDVAGIVLGRRMVIPATIADDYRAFLARCVDAAVQARATVGELDELFETGFRGAEVGIVEKLIEELDRIEKDTDRMQITLRAAVFRQERELPPVEVMFLYKVIEGTGALADTAQRIGARLQLLLAN